jgi:hypothetical protein
VQLLGELGDAIGASRMCCASGEALGGLTDKVESIGCPLTRFAAGDNATTGQPGFSLRNDGQSDQHIAAAEGCRARRPARDQDGDRCVAAADDAGAVRAPVLDSGEHSAASQQPHHPRLVEDAGWHAPPLRSAVLVSDVANWTLPVANHHLDVSTTEHASRSGEDDFGGGVERLGTGLPGCIGEFGVEPGFSGRSLLHGVR